MNNEININNNSVNNEANLNDNKKRKNKCIIIVISVIVLIILGIVIFKLLNSNNNNSKSLDEELTSSTSFFLKNEEGMYALFNIDGKRITDYEFKYVYDFINGAAEVENENGDAGIISATGKPILKYGVCKYLNQKGAFFKCVDKENNNILLTSTGKTVLKGKNIDITSYIGEYKYILVKNENKYIVYDYKGNSMTSFSISDDKNVKSPSANSEKDYVSIFYNNMNYIFDVSKSKLILSFKDQKHYCINSVNENNKDEIILRTCTSWGESQEETGLKFIKNGKVIFTKTIGKYGSLIFDENNIIFDDGSYKYLLDDQGNQVIKTYNTIYKDYKNYITRAEGYSNGADLYVNGKKKENFKCNTIESSSSKYSVYLLKYCSGYGDGNKIYINYDGTRINDKSYKSASSFDKNGYASVSEDGINYYMINLKGEKVSDVYSNKRGYSIMYLVEGSNELYIVINSDEPETLFRINDKKILTGEKITTEEVNGVIYALVKESDDKYTIYNVDKNKKLITVDAMPSLYKNYFIVKNNSKEQYYSYTTGKMFYEE